MNLLLERCGECGKACAGLCEGEAERDSGNDTDSSGSRNELQEVDEELV